MPNFMSGERGQERYIGTMARAWLVSVGVFLLVSAQGCATTCTDAGCGPSMSLEIRAADGTWPDGVYALELSVDGVAHTCSMTLPDDIPASGGLALSGCGLTLSPDQVAGQYTLRSWSSSTPRTLSVRVTRDEALLIDETRTVAYEDSRPNGPECGPVCRSATVDFQLPWDG